MSFEKEYKAEKAASVASISTEASALADTVADEQLLLGDGPAGDVQAPFSSVSASPSIPLPPQRLGANELLDSPDPSTALVATAHDSPGQPEMPATAAPPLLTEASSPSDTPATLPSPSQLPLPTAAAPPSSASAAVPSLHTALRLYTSMATNDPETAGRTDTFLSLLNQREGCSTSLRVLISPLEHPDPSIDLNVTTFRDLVTHVAVEAKEVAFPIGEGERGYQRTRTVVAAMIAGVQLVSMDWMKDSLTADVVLSSDAYIIDPLTNFRQLLFLPCLPGVESDVSIILFCFSPLLLMLFVSYL